MVFIFQQNEFRKIILTKKKKKYGINNNIEIQK